MAMASSLAPLNRLIISSSNLLLLHLRPMASRLFTTKSAPPLFDLLDDDDDRMRLISFSSDRQGLSTRHSAIDTKESLHFRFDMPGVGKQGVEVLVKPTQVTINGQRKADPDTKECEGLCTTTFPIFEECFKLDQIKVNMKNGVHKVVLPKSDSFSFHWGLGE